MPRSMFVSRARTVLALALTWGCQDYTFAEEPKPATGDDTAAEVDTQVETGADSGVDTGSAVDSVPVDSAPEDTAPEDTAPEDSGGPPVASESVYLNSASTLYAFDPTTQTATVIGTFRSDRGAVTDMTDIAISLDGHLYGGSFTQLYEIDPTNARCVEKFALSDSGTGMTFLSDGRLVIAGAGVNVYDVSTGARETLVAAGRYSTSGDIIGLPDGFLYWTVQGGDQLVKINPSTGSAAVVGDLGVSGIYGLGYADGVTYGFTSGNKVIEIDETRGSVTATHSLSGTWWGATTNPVLW